jgi:hypothetical protein
MFAEIFKAKKWARHGVPVMFLLFIYVIWECCRNKGLKQLYEISLKGNSRGFTLCINIFHPLKRIEFMDQTSDKDPLFDTFLKDVSIEEIVSKSVLVWVNQTSWSISEFLDFAPEIFSESIIEVRKISEGQFQVLLQKVAFLDREDLQFRFKVQPLRLWYKIIPPISVFSIQEIRKELEVQFPHKIIEIERSSIRCRQHQVFTGEVRFLVNFPLRGQEAPVLKLGKMHCAISFDSEGYQEWLHQKDPQTFSDSEVGSPIVPRHYQPDFIDISRSNNPKHVSTDLLSFLKKQLTPVANIADVGVELSPFGSLPNDIFKAIVTILEPIDLYYLSRVSRSLS